MSYINSTMVKARRMFNRLTVGCMSLGLVAGGALYAQAVSPSLDNAGIIKVTKAGVESWSSSATINRGEAVNVFVTAHNTSDNTVAKNTRVKIGVPSTMSASSSVSTQISADGITSVNGNATVLTNTASKLEYVPGSAVLYKNENGQYTKDVWGTGVNPDDVVGNGVNIGDISGGWNGAKAVMAQFVAYGNNPQAFTTLKTNVTGGDQVYADQTSVRPGNVVNFRVFLQNTGDGVGHDPQMSVTLDSRLSYVPGSSQTRVKINNQDVDIKITDDMIRKEGQKLTWQFADMAPLPDAARYLVFQAKVADAAAFPANTVTALKQTATTSFLENANSPVSTNQVSVNVTTVNLQPVSFSLLKQVRNETLGDTQWHRSPDPISAAVPGDKLAYRLQITNTGTQAAENVILKDILPSGLAFDGGVTFYNKTTGQAGRTISGDALVKEGLNLGTIQSGNSDITTVIFNAKVAGSCTSTHTVLNKAQVVYQGQVKAESSADTLITCQRGFQLNKEILDPATGQFKDTIGLVDADTVLTYRITVLSNKEETVVSPTVRDVLPQMVTYVPDSLTIDSEVMAKQVQDNFFSEKGIILTNFTPGMGKVIEFKVKALCPPQDFKIVNTAYAWAQGIEKISDTATATLSFESCHVVTPPTTKPPVKPVAPTKPGVPVLPETGPEAALLLIGGMGASGAYVGRMLTLKKKLQAAVRGISIV